MAVPGQGDGELGECPGFAVNGFLAAVPMNDRVVTDRKAEAGSLTGRFRREERIEKFLAHFFRHPRSVVADPDPNGIATVLSGYQHPGLVV